MIPYEHMTAGLIRFVHTEMLPHLDGFKKVAFAAYLDLSANNAVQQLKAAAAAPAVAMTGIFQEDGVDIDRLYKSVSDHMGGPMEIMIPMIGKFSLGRADVDKLYNYMKGVL